MLPCRDSICFGEMGVEVRLDCEFKDLAERSQNADRSVAAAVTVILAGALEYGFYNARLPLVGDLALGKTPC